MILRRLAFLAGLAALAALGSAAHAQSWGMVEQEGQGGAGAYVCPVDDEETGNFFCFRMGCTDVEALGYEITLAGGDAPETLDVTVQVDGAEAGILRFSRAETDDIVTLTAPFDPRLHRDLVIRLRKGNQANLVLGYEGGPREVPMSLRGSSRTLGAVMQTCPMPEVPLDDPAAVVLDEVARECRTIGGTVVMEPGFERREDLDGDGREDVVIDYAAAVCSEMPSLYCGSGGCTVGFFLARGAAYKKLFSGVIRGYVTKPGGRLALDLHGTACGLYGFEACRKIFDVTGDTLLLVETLAGDAAIAAMAADDAPAEVADPAKEPEAPQEPAAPAEVPAEVSPDPPAADKPPEETVTPAGAEAAAEAGPEPDAESAPAGAGPAAASEPSGETQGNTPEAVGAAEEDAPAPTGAAEGDTPAPEPPVEPEQPEPEQDPAPEKPRALIPTGGPAPPAGAAALPEAPTDPDLPPAGTGAAAAPQAPAQPATEPAPDAPAAEAVLPAPVLPEGGAAPPVLEWTGDGGSVFLPHAGEQLPDDLAPAESGDLGGVRQKK